VEGRFQVPKIEVGRKPAGKAYFMDIECLMGRHWTPPINQTSIVRRICEALNFKLLQVLGADHGGKHQGSPAPGSGGREVIGHT
jgi:hypothetical protein